MKVLKIVNLSKEKSTACSKKFHPGFLYWAATYIPGNRSWVFSDTMYAHPDEPEYGHCFLKKKKRIRGWQAKALGSCTCGLYKALSWMISCNLQTSLGQSLTCFSDSSLLASAVPSNHTSHASYILKQCPFQIFPPVDSPQPTVLTTNPHGQCSPCSFSEYSRQFLIKM